MIFLGEFLILLNKLSIQTQRTAHNMQTVCYEKHGFQQKQSSCARQNHLQMIYQPSHLNSMESLSLLEIKESEH